MNLIEQVWGNVKKRELEKKSKNKITAIPRAMRAAASITCSQLSSISTRRFVPRAEATRSVDSAPAESVSPSATATVTGNEAGIGERRELGDPHPVGVTRHQLARGLQAQPGLADTAGPDQRDEPMGPQQLRHLRERGRPADQLRGRGRQVRRWRGVRQHGRRGGRRDRRSALAQHR